MYFAFLVNFSLFCDFCFLFKFFHFEKDKAVEFYNLFCSFYVIDLNNNLAIVWGVNELL